MGVINFSLYYPNKKKGRLLVIKSTKLLMLIIFILLSVLITVFTGCADTALSPDEMKITDVIYGYFQAISDQDWDGARSYCVYESTPYNDVNKIKELWYPDSAEIEGIDIDFIVEDIDTIIITGEYAEAQVYINGVIIYNGEIVDENPGEILFVYLQKIDDSWKLYNIEE